MTENERREREAFEGWALEEQLAYHDQNGFWFYEAGAGHLYWRGFQAARASLSASTPNAEAVMQRLSKQAQSRTSPENVADVLEALAAMAPPADNKENGNG